MAALEVQTSGANSAASATQKTSIPYTWASTPKVGNKLILAVAGYQGNGASITVSVTDNASPPNTYTARSSGIASDNSAFIFECDITAAPTITTINATGAGIYCSFVAMEWSGLTVGGFDTQASRAVPSGVGFTPVTVGPTATLAQAAELAISAVTVDYAASPVGFSVPSGWTAEGYEQNNATLESIGVGSLITSATTALTPGWGISTYPSNTGTVALALATFKIASGGTAINPAAGSLAIAGAAPTISQPNALTPGAASLALSGYAPGIAQPVSVTSGASSLTLAGYVPGIAQPKSIGPSTASLLVAGYAPAFVQTANQIVSPAQASLTTAGYAPAIGQTASGSIQPASAALSVTCYPPSVGQFHAAIPGPAVIALSGAAPSIIQTLNQGVVPGPAQIIVAGPAPTVGQGAGQMVQPDPAALTVYGWAPRITLASPNVSDPRYLATAQSRNYAAAATSITSAAGINKAFVAIAHLVTDSAQGNKSNYTASK